MGYIDRIHGRMASRESTLSVGEPVRSGLEMDQHTPNLEKDAGSAQTVTDPVCGMKVTPGKDARQAEHAGRRYYFCGAKCREKFIADPAKYLGPKAKPPSAAPGIMYTCPMHPQIRQNKPGSCPICG